MPLCLCGRRLLAQNTTDATKNYHDLNPGLQISFSKQVAPIFQAKCVTCHSKTANMGGFVLSDFESLMKGGSHGKAIVPGKEQRKSSDADGGRHRAAAHADER